MNRSPSQSLCAWARLMRVPNYFTVPGDVIAGFVLAGGVVQWTGTLAWAVVVALFLYAFGIVLNDLVDVEVDHRERPSRPLPSGAIPVSHARMAAGLFAAVAIGVAATVAQPVLLPALMLIALIVAYDLSLKRIPVLGEMAMAGCRAGNVLLGAYAVTKVAEPTSVAVGMGIIFVYVFALSLLARHETRLGIASWIGAMVRGLILVQAVLIVAGGEPVVGLGVAALWIPATLLGRRFYSS